MPTSSEFIMTGDSCHLILPYMAQGANLSFEDAAVLGAVLASVETPAQLESAVRI